MSDVLTEFSSIPAGTGARSTDSIRTSAAIMIPPCTLALSRSLSTSRLLAEILLPSTRTGPPMFSCGTTAVWCHTHVHVVMCGCARLTNHPTHFTFLTTYLAASCSAQSPRYQLRPPQRSLNTKRRCCIDCKRLWCCAHPPTLQQSPRTQTVGKSGWGNAG